MNDDSPADRDADRLPDTWLHVARSSYHAPGDTPREEIWQALEARLFEAEGPDEAPSGSTDLAFPAPLRPRFGRWVGLLAAASVALLLGLGLGRWSAAPAGSDTVADAPAEAPTAVPAGTPVPRSGTAVRFAAARHLSDAEALLAFVAADAREGRTDRDVGVWGRTLLTQTRLLLDSSVSDDPAVRGVLEDLELVLAQIALLAAPDVDAARVRSELDLIARGVDETGVRSRIHSVLPSVDRGLAAADD